MLPEARKERITQSGVPYRIAWLGSALLVGFLYYWVIGIGAETQRFAWDSGLEQFYGLGTAQPGINSGGAVYEYYGLLGRAFATGKFSLPVKPRPELVALADPWDDRISRPYRLLDAAFYRGKFYLYHGPVPALLFFTPWYLVTRHDLPENFAAFLICFGAYLILCELFLLVTSCLRDRLPLPLFALLLLTLGIAQSVPFLLHRPKVYE